MDITIIQSADHDWIALYEDGYLVSQGHSLDLVSVFRKLDCTFTIQEIPNSVAEWVAFENPLSEVLSEIDEYEKSDAGLSVEELQQERQ